MASQRADAWESLHSHGRTLAGVHLRKMFQQNPHRCNELRLELEGLLLDFSRQRLVNETLDLLVNLAHACGVEPERKRMLSGKPINVTENRAVRHVDLRLPPKLRDREVNRVVERMETLATALRSGKLTGVRNRPLRHLINLGIGGSDLGPRMAVHALGSASLSPDIHFVANLDMDELAPVLERLDADATLVCVVSKSFTTRETMANAAVVRAWLKKSLGRKQLGAQLVAVTAQPGRAQEWGVPAERILPFWDWVGGRFSLSSAVGFPLMVALGPQGFAEFQAGMHAVDLHFETAPLRRNIPVIMALLGVWNGNVLGARSHAVLPYSQALRWFPLFLQQLEMESNGKSVDRRGRVLIRDSAPVIWGDVGTNAQHAFFQHLHQGTFFTPCDFIGFAHPRDERFLENHQLLLANLLAQSAALAFGRTAEEAEAAGIPPTQIPWRVFPGNRPSSTLMLDRLSPFNLGRLIAIYEHKVFVQGVLWDVFSFDQWGVELGKGIAVDVQKNMSGRESTVDIATRELINWINRA
ncbi:MAG TPA: glucose-6-phosphate isomerase [Candidatus Aminicenantes bacterium]|nr:glucose-6-phosphate isomerase [Candidatus Aminicenantes bacterium]